MSTANPHASPRRSATLFALLGLAVLSVAGLSACIGSTALSIETVFKALTGAPDIDPVLQQIVIDFRLPRILTSILAGAALATAGLMMQTIFRNPLADPFVLGVNSGASLGVAIVLLALAPTGLSLTAGLGVSGQILLILASSGGAAITLFTVLVLSRKVDIMSVLIIGLMISYTVGALVSILMYFSMAERLQSFLSWSFGDYGNVSWTQMRAFAPAIHRRARNQPTVRQTTRRPATRRALCRKRGHSHTTRTHHHPICRFDPRWHGHWLLRPYRLSRHRRAAPQPLPVPHQQPPCIDPRVDLGRRPALAQCRLHRPRPRTRRIATAQCHYRADRCARDHRGTDQATKP